MDVKLKLSILGYRRIGRLGFAGETLAEGYAFELERRYKQAFFCYFSALESYLEVMREAFNETAAEDRSISENGKLPDKLGRLAAAALPPTISSLNGVSHWGWLKGRFGEMVKLRNAVARNRPTRR